MIWIGAVAVTPWLVLLGVLAFGVRRPRQLPEGDPRARSGEGPDDVSVPSVRVVIPARDEARSIERCLASLTAQAYPRFRVVVVDDRSGDGTAERAAAVPVGNASAVDVLAGEALSAGWFGKPWACWQGAMGATEDLLLFTDADTHHGPDLLSRAVKALRADEADALSLLGRQELGSFWERLLQPQVFTLLALRYLDLTRPLERADTDDAIANGQYILVTREAYEGIEGHRAVRDEVAEDLRLAQLLTGAGHRLTIRSAESSFSTRMYESLYEIVEGWTKNMSVGARQAAGWWGILALPAIVAFQLLFWVLPPLVLLGVLAFGAGGAVAGGPWTPAISETPGVPALLVWSGGATFVGLLAWVGVYRDFEVPARYAALFPVGALLIAWIGVRSGMRGRRRIDWKGRRYTEGDA